MSEYELYLKAYALTRVGQRIPDVTGKRNALAVALGVCDAKDNTQLCSESRFDECMKQKLA